MSAVRRPLGLTLIAALTLTAAALSPALAQEATVAPPAAMVMENVPPVRASLASSIAKYSEFKPTSYASWHPTKLEMISRAATTTRRNCSASRNRARSQS